MKSQHVVLDGGTMGDGVGPTLRRRRLLGALGTGASALLAGCTLGQGEQTDERAIEHSSQVLGHPFPYLTENFELNPWSARYVSGFPTLLYAYQTTTRPSGERTLTDLLSGVKQDGQVVTVTYSDQYTWWNGEPVTARDRWVAHRIDELLGVSTPLDAFELVDEYTLRYTFGQSLREELVLEAVGSSVLNTPAWLFEEWVDRLSGASIGDERDAVRDDLQATSISLSDAMEMGYGCGPYELIEVSPNRLVLERYDAHPNANQIAIPRLWFPVAKNNRLQELTADGVLDLSQTDLMSGNLVRSTPSYIEQLDEHPSNFGTKFLFNWQADHLRRRNVRRAVLSILPLPLIVSNAEWGTATTVQTGLSLAAQRRWLDDDLVSSLHRYPVERDDARAAEFMRQEGYERPNGTWLAPDGSRAEIALLAPLWGEWSDAVQTMTETLREFGFVIDLTTFPASSFLAKVQRSGFQMTTWWTNGTPFAAYDVTSTALQELGYGLEDLDDERQTAARGKPVKPTIPAEPGALSVTDEGETVDLVELWRELQEPISSERTREIVAQFARWWNYDLPDLHLSTLTTEIWGNTRDFEWPEPGSAAYRQSGPANRIDYELLQRGAIRPRTDAQ